MKRIILLTLLIPVLAHAQRYGHTSAGAAGAGSTANVRANTGWTSDGTTAQDTLATVYRLDKANIRFIVTDADGDTLWFYPQNLLPFVLKDGTTILAAIDSTGRAGFGTSTSGQATRAYLNVLRRSGADTLALFIGDGNGAPGDSTVIIFANGSALFGSAINISSTGVFQIGGYNVLSRGGGNIVIGSGYANTGISGGAGLGSYFNSSAAGRWQAVANVRAGSVSSDTLFMVRNDWNTTLDSTFLVFPTGHISRTDAKALPASAWLETASNGAALSSSNYIVTYAFDQTTAETLTVDFALPPNFGMINNVEIEVISPNTDGDSVGFAIAWLGRAADEAFDVAFSSPLSGQIDLGTTANVRKILTISGTFSNLAASDRLIFKLWRDPSVDNNVAADVHLVDVRVNGNGLLY